MIFAESYRFNRKSLVLDSVKLISTPVLNFIPNFPSFKETLLARDPYEISLHLLVFHDAQFLKPTGRVKDHKSSFVINISKLGYKTRTS